ncbi:DAK2 domain-containing protein [Corynebacterium pygosceleis]|uniref:DAK2 domain-containing protein n=1 Tax=Corynebacterium pygosceleis TaxID=2800406 RepID=A0A9Q4CAC4_9CORY|nr:DAK2 domain-containing protein [Corynebacterium pygosceleis]MCK7637817.1 DAK2 domain-containing protein [Corynebacterium pygosceleis]MCK7675531.1 DAK2 domain-containing protein [Corynebacterium pygosceleis]MCL0121075.1 DAK2 domain-containing protein [Corynebacterium pygosceleis]MCX7444643.1 DAK2 domain-containing protein [Corynebacterium pygosceleis]MCX7468533.1 DAK2 domain-containing protein [Corynebacterium pygosceleis]
MASDVSLDGTALLSWAERAVDALSTRREEINGLNVFPVPDADTGSNMTYTMEAALAEAAKLDDGEKKSAHAVAAALAAGSVRGARGNSGVVLSQVISGMAQAAASGSLDGGCLKNSLSIAVRLVDRAITEPVEGTVVTVLRATAVAAGQAGDGLRETAAAAVEAARTALMKTPSQLEVLRSAGVVDAGGAGLVVLLQSLLDEIEGISREDGVVDSFGEPGARPAASLGSTGCETRHGRTNQLEIMCFLRLTGDTTLETLRDSLADGGDSLVLAPVDTDPDGPVRAVTVHIHSATPGPVIEELFHAGEVTDLRLEVLPGSPQVETRHRAVMAVAPDGPLAELYRQAGAIVVTPVPSGDRPDDTDTVSKILAELRTHGIGEVILLPNGLLSRREMVSAELAAHAAERTMTILPTARLVSGIAALAVHDPDQPVAVDSYAMAEAAGSMRTAVLQRAEKAALTLAGPCSRGDVLVTSGTGVLLVADDLQTALEQTCTRLLGRGGELVTLLLTDEAASEIDLARFTDHLPGATGSIEGGADVEVMVYPAEGLAHLAEIGVE